jgi:hypothetical protein
LVVIQDDNILLASIYKDPINTLVDHFIYVSENLGFVVVEELKQSNVIIQPLIFTSFEESKKSVIYELDDSFSVVSADEDIIIVAEEESTSVVETPLSFVSIKENKQTTING